jgi:hypothetical protein
LGWATITHPFHPLRNQRFEVLKTRRVAGVDTLILRHPDRGSYAVSREWTDWGLEAAAYAEPAQRLAAGTLLQLATLLDVLAKRGQEDLDE